MNIRKASYTALVSVPIFLAVSPVTGSFAKDAQQITSALNIEAVVNDTAISSFDVNNRIRFVLATTRISNTPDTIAKIKPQVIRTLIDEALQMQEAEKNGIKVDDGEVVQAISSMEQQRQMPQGAVSDMLKANNIPEKTFDDQVRSQLAWGKVLARFVRPRVKVSDEEVALAQGHISSPEPAIASIKAMEISVINLPVDKPSRTSEVKKLAAKLYSELQNGANFKEIARQFSAGGDTAPFWIAPDQLSPNIAQTLKRSKTGTITPPIETGNGISIIKLLNIRTGKNPEKTSSPAQDNSKDFSVTLKEILLKLKPDTDTKEADVLLQIGAEVAKNPGSCEEKTVADIGDLDSFNIEVNLLKTTLSELSPALRGVSENLKIGEVSTPFASVDGIRMYMLCEKKEINGKIISNDKIKDGLFRQKFELEAQKYLRSLQRNAFIDIRK